MDEKIFVKEQTEMPKRNNLALAILAGALLIIGLGGLLLLTSNSNSGAKASPTPSASAVVSASPVATVSATPVATAQPTATASPSAGTATYTAPTDSTKINVYFPKSPETDENPAQLVAVLRDKPASDTIISFTVSQVINGPTAAEKALGYKSTWSFAKDSTCSGKTFKYGVYSKTLRVELCKEFTGTNSQFFIDALNHSMVEQGRFTKVAVLTPAGSCLGLASGDTSCL